MKYALHGDGCVPAASRSTPCSGSKKQPCWLASGEKACIDALQLDRGDLQSVQSLSAELHAQASMPLSIFVQPFYIWGQECRHLKMFDASLPACMSSSKLFSSAHTTTMQTFIPKGVATSVACISMKDGIHVAWSPCRHSKHTQLHGQLCCIALPVSALCSGKLGRRIVASWRYSADCWTQGRC